MENPIYVFKITFDDNTTILSGEWINYICPRIRKEIKIKMRRKFPDKKVTDLELLGELL